LEKDESSREDLRRLGRNAETEFYKGRKKLGFKRRSAQAMSKSWLRGQGVNGPKKAAAANSELKSRGALKWETKKDNIYDDE